MAGPGDALFMALANAKSQPSHALRAVESAGQAGSDIMGGYMSGKEMGQQLAKYRILNTKLGDIFQDPSTIPAGLTPDHTISDLMNMAPILPYVRSDTTGQLMNELAGGNNQPPSTSAPAVPSAPIAGSANPSVPPGTTNLASIQGAGAGLGANLPVGTSPTIQAPASPRGPNFGKASLMDLQRYAPILNDIRQGRQFQQGQANENERAQLSRDQQERNFQEAQGNEKNRAIAGQQDEFTKSVNRTMSGFDALNQLTSLYDKIPPNQKGAYIGQATKFAGPMTGQQSPELATYNQARHAFIGNFAAALDPMGRQNQALLTQVESMTPKVEDDARVVANKVSAMHQFLQSTVDRNYQGFNAAAQNIGGQISRPVIPPNTYFESEADVPSNLPVGAVIHIAGRRALIKPPNQ